MIKWIGKFSTQFPALILLAVASITAVMIYQIKENTVIEADTTKFMPTSMPTTKANDYFKKNFNYQDRMLIGAHATTGTILDVDKLRRIEKVVKELKELTLEKTFYSHLTGKQETLTMPTGFDQEDISSISNLEDAILDKATGAVVTGSVIAKLKKERNIPFTKETEERLPEKDADLVSITPALRDYILADRSFRGNYLTEDLKSSTLQAPMVRKWDYKRRFTRKEIATAISKELLKARLMGQDPFFKFDVYGKTINGTTYNDQFIANHSKRMGKLFHGKLIQLLEDIYDAHPPLKALLAQDFSLKTFEKVMTYIEAHSFFMHPDMVTWENFTNRLYDYTLEKIDPLSRENLEYKAFDVVNIYDLNEVYNKSLEILNRHAGDDLKFYVAGSPVVTAVTGHMISKDIVMLLPIAIGIIFLVLLFSFKSARGVIIPLFTVVLSMIWTMGSMALLGIPITMMTSMLPIVLLAVGSAYGIHLLNRYYEDVSVSDHRKSVLRITVEHVGVAIVMAGITTSAGFISLASSDLEIIQHFGLFTALGVAYALILTLTLSPAVLTWWKLPRGNTYTKKRERGDQQLGVIDRFIKKVSHTVLSHSKMVVIGFGVIFLSALVVIPQLEFEGGQMAMLKPDNPMRQADKFINMNLSGSGQINMILKFRDKVNLKNGEIIEILENRSRVFSKEWNSFIQSASKAPIFENLAHSLEKQVQSPVEQRDQLEKTIHLIKDILNEEYEVVNTSEVAGTSSDLSALDMDGDMNALMGETSTEDDIDLGSLGDATTEISTEKELPSAFQDLTSDQIEGLKALNRRLGKDESQWEENGKKIISLRTQKNSPKGIKAQRAFNELQDLFAVDVKQPLVLEKVEKIYHMALALETPTIQYDNKTYSPTGFVSTPVDLIRKFYKVFYHNDDPKYDRLPNVDTDNLSDKTMTNRSVIGVVLNQALSSSRDTFESVIRPDLKEFQLSILARSDKSAFIDAYTSDVLSRVKAFFPKDDPYIEEVKVGGYAPTVTEITGVLSSSQVKSIGLAFILVFIVTFFIFKSVVGGLYSLIPLLFTIVANFGMIYLLGWQIDTGTMLVASIAIGVGVDYTIHFLERYKIELKYGNSPEVAYFNTLETTGRAVVINAISVSAGFLVLLFSDFVSNISLGVLMAGTMIYSSVSSLILLPAIIFILKPKFFKGTEEQSKITEPELLEKTP